MDGAIAAIVALMGVVAVVGNRRFAPAASGGRPGNRTHVIACRVFAVVVGSMLLSMGALGVFGIDYRDLSR